MDDKYIKLKALLQYLFLYLVLILGLVRGDGQCRHVESYQTATQNNGTNMTAELCVRNITCLQFKEKISISWLLPQGSQGSTMDFFIKLSNVKIVGQDSGFKYARSTHTSLEVTRGSTDPNLDFGKDYNVTIYRRYSRSSTGKAYQISKECTKEDNPVTQTKPRSTTTIKPTTAFVNTTKRNGETKRRHTGSSQNINKKTPTTDQINGKKTTAGQDLGTKDSQNTNAGNQNLRIGLCSAGGIGIVVVTIVIIICTKRRKQNKQGTQNESKGQNGSESNRFEEEDTYNHLSHDHHVLNNERGRQRNYLTNDDGEEEDTYNHMSLRYHDNKGTTEAALQDTYSHIALAKKEDSANRKQISTPSAGNYDDISFKDEGDKEQGDKGRGEGGQSGSNSDKSNTSVPVDVHKVINADVPSTSENETGTALSRTEGPKGDLYTEVAIKN